MGGGRVKKSVFLKYLLLNSKLDILDIFLMMGQYFKQRRKNQSRSSKHTCMQILILAGFLTLGLIYPEEKQLGSISQLQKLCTLFPQALIYLKVTMLIYMLMTPSLNSKHAQTRCENLLETSKLDRWTVLDPLYTLSLTSFLALYK